MRLTAARSADGADRHRQRRGHGSFDHVRCARSGKPRSGAASGLVNVANQLGGSVGLSMLIMVFAANANPQLTGAAQMGHKVSAVLIGAALMNMLALVLTALFILPANRKKVDPCVLAAVACPIE